MRILFIVIIIIFHFNARSQNPGYDTYTIDTIYLNEIQFRKVVSYKINEVTLFVDYQDYRKALSIAWKGYHNGMKGIEKEKQKGEYLNPDYERRYRIIDSIYNLLKIQIKSSDTIFLSQKVFDNVGLGALGNFFPDLLEKGECAVNDENNQRQLLIIRQRGFRIRGSSDGYGGRAYFLPGKKNYFVAARDWML